MEVVQPSPSVPRKYHSEEMAAMTTVLPVHKDAGVWGLKVYQNNQETKGPVISTDGIKMTVMFNKGLVT